MALADENVALVRRWFEEVWERRRSEAIEEFLDEESVLHGDLGVMRGPDEFRAKMHTPFLAAFPDLKIEVEAVLASDQEVAFRWTATGCHTGDGLGMAPSNTDCCFRGMTWIRAVDGKMREGWQVSNIPEILRGLGTGLA
ncbi:ester cyclase [Aquisphaera insulae]|uniref:ester cyclase n=1 Tax=Aquisphaera insulae TaxID=2712864 RepID=UPI002030F25D|nr:ester cyclase [Aquisphaera insulae]